jgi:hypothetical protein
MMTGRPPTRAASVIKSDGSVRRQLASAAASNRAIGRTRGSGRKGQRPRRGRGPHGEQGKDQWLAVVRVCTFDKCLERKLQIGKHLKLAAKSETGVSAKGISRAIYTSRPYELAVWSGAQNYRQSLALSDGYSKVVKG